jgi:hypothetical protein
MKRATIKRAAEIWLPPRGRARKSPRSVLGRRFRVAFRHGQLRDRALSRLNPSTSGSRAISQYRNRGAMPSLVVAIAQHIARDALLLDTE